MSFGLINRAFCPKYVFKCICCSYECEEYGLNYCKSLTGTKCFALWHSSNMRHPLNCSPPHQSMSCCNLLWRLAPVKKKTKKTDQQKQKPFPLSRSVHTRRQFAATRRSDRSLHVYRSGDELQQQGEVTRRSDKSLCVSTGEFLWKISLSPQQNFVAATSRKKSNQTESVRLVAATKFFCSNRFSQNSPVHTKRFVAATCLHDMLLQLVA